MELIKKEASKTDLKTGYKLEIQFMEGDADGYETTVEYFGDDNKVDMESLKATIMALARCNAAYPNGMSGYDTYNGLPEYDVFFDDDYNEDDEEYTALVSKLNPGDVYLKHPSGYEGMTTSFDGYWLTYINPDGSEIEVEIQFTEEEQKYIQEAGEILN